MRALTSPFFCLIPFLLFSIGCEDRNWEPVEVELSMQGEYGDGSKLDISGKWGPHGDPVDRIEGVRRQSNSNDLRIDIFTPNQDTGDHEWVFSIAEMQDPFFLWDEPFGEIEIFQIPGSAYNVTNLKMKVDELRLDGRLWADASFSAEIDQEGNGSAKIEGKAKLSYQCSNKFWAFGGFCGHFDLAGEACTLVTPPENCPTKLAETFYAEGAKTNLEYGQLTFGAEPLEKCDTDIPHNEKTLNTGGADGYVAPGACLSEPRTVSADGCDWTVQAAAYSQGGVNISARAQDGCSREVKSCLYTVRCTVDQNQNLEE